jgi:hypothetical protein
MGLCGPSFNARLVPSSGFRMSSPMRKTVSSRRIFVSSPPGGRNIVGSPRRRGDPAGGSGALAINIPVGAGNLAGFVLLPPRRRSSCISPSAMKAWVLGGLRADRRRPGLGLCGNSWARCDDLGGISTIAWNSPAPPRRGRVCGFFALGPAQCRAPGKRTWKRGSRIEPHHRHSA